MNNNILAILCLGLVTLFAGFSIISTANTTKEAWSDSSIAVSSSGNSMDQAIIIIKSL